MSAILYNIEPYSFSERVTKREDVYDCILHDIVQNDGENSSTS